MAVMVGSSAAILVRSGMVGANRLLRRYVVARAVTVAAASYVYLIFLFALMFWLGDVPVSDTYSGRMFDRRTEDQPTPAAVGASVVGPEAPPSFVEIAYFSAMTMFTQGYSDLAPRSAYAKVLVTLESYSGTLFLAAFVPLVLTWALDAQREEERSTEQQPAHTLHVEPPAEQQPAPTPHGSDAWDDQGHLPQGKLVQSQPSRPPWRSTSHPGGTSRWTANDAALLPVVFVAGAVAGVAARSVRGRRDKHVRS
jgi:hypothetical protein